MNELYKYLIVCPMVFAAGFIDSIAGGGGLITIPAYILAGLPIHNVLATNKMSSSMGTTCSVIQYGINGFIEWKIALISVIFSLFGSALGSNLALLISEFVFQIFMLVALPPVAIYVLKTKNFDVQKESYSFGKTLAICIVTAFFLGMYDGFYGPGTGAFLLLLFTSLARIPLNKAVGSTKVLNLASNYAALAVYIYNGKVLFPLGITAGFFSMAGNFIGSRTFSKKGGKIVRPVILLVLVIFFIKLIYNFISAARS